jgi:fumarate hydratase class II
LRILKAAAYANCDLGVLPIESDAIAAVCDEILAGKLEMNFLVIWQTGSGTKSNMNVNEVVANRAQVLKGFAIGEGGNSLKQMMMSTSHNHQTIHSLLVHIAAYKAVVEVTIQV